MIITKPNVEPDGIYNMTQAAKALQIDRHTLRRYADEGLVKLRIRKAGKRPVVLGSDIIKCWRAVYL